MKRSEFKAMLKEAKLKSWEVAAEMGVHEHTIIYWFHNLEETCTDERALRIKTAIDRVKAKKGI